MRPLVRRILTSEEPRQMAAAGGVGAISAGAGPALPEVPIPPVASQTARMIDMAQVQGQVLQRSRCRRSASSPNATRTRRSRSCASGSRTLRSDRIMAAAAKSGAKQNEIADLVATLAGRQAASGPGRQLTGPERAAVLMLALGEQHGEKVWKLLDDDELRQLSIVMSTIGTVEAESVEGLLLRIRRTAVGLRRGSATSTPPSACWFNTCRPIGSPTSLEEIRGPAGRNMWEKLSNVQEQVLANYLKNEYPRRRGGDLEKSVRSTPRACWRSCPRSSRSTSCRACSNGAVQKDVIERLENTLRTEFMSNLSQTRRRDAHEVMAEIFNNFDRQTETRFITALEEHNREAAERIKTLMFTFDDLIKLDAGSGADADAPRRQGQARRRAEGRD